MNPGDPLSNDRPGAVPVWSRLGEPRRRRSARVVLIAPIVMLVLIALALGTHSNAARSLRVATVGGAVRQVVPTDTGPSGPLTIHPSATTACVTVGSEPLILPYGWGVRTNPLRIVDLSGATRAESGQIFAGATHEQSGQAAFCPASGSYLVVDEFEAGAKP